MFIKIGNTTVMYQAIASITTEHYEVVIKTVDGSEYKLPYTGMYTPEEMADQLTEAMADYFATQMLGNKQ